MQKKPKALQLAEFLEKAPYACSCTQEAADELQRQYAENKAMSDTSSQIIADNARLHEANQAMLEALKSLEGVGSVIKWDGQWVLCIAAIAKGETE